MIILPDKGKCKLKQFNKSLIIGNFVYMEFMNPKTWYSNKYRFGELKTRDMTPRKKIFKVVDKHRLELIYFNKRINHNEYEWLKPDKDNLDTDYNKENSWAMYGDNPPTTLVFNSHNIWSWFQHDEVRNIRSMTKDELAEELLMELL